MYFCWTLWTLVLVVRTDALKQGEPGVCIARIPKTRIIQEKYTGGEFIEKCCDSYVYVYENGTEQCVPECEDECEGGTCVAPNVCVCAPPLVLHNATTPHRCIPPICENPCIYGVCTANNQCTCNDGYTLKEDNFTCVAQCTNCSNGDCVSPNVCECRKGYSMENGQCAPQCKSDCRNGFCSSPDVCTCDHGYEFKDEKCQPVCEKPCVNADCIAPDNCKCFEGFVIKDGDKETCIPKCESCDHGVCLAPNKCECLEGYKLVGKDCLPVCDVCVNGDCVAPNVCSCKDGYTQDAVNSSVCFKRCDVCNGGECNLEGQCICEADMDLINGTCVPSTPSEPSGIMAPTGLASLQLTWWVGGAVALLLTVLVLVAISRIWHTRKDYSQKTPDEGNHGSVFCTLPNTLMRDGRNELDEGPSEVLLTKETSVV